MLWNALLLSLREIRRNLMRSFLTTLGVVPPLVGWSCQKPMAAVPAGKPKNPLFPKGPIGPTAEEFTALVRLPASPSIDSEFTGPYRPRSMT